MFFHKTSGYRDVAAIHARQLTPIQMAQIRGVICHEAACPFQTQRHMFNPSEWGPLALFRGSVYCEERGACADVRVLLEQK